MTVVFRRNPSIEASPMPGEALLFNPATNRFCLLNGTAAFVWDRLEQPATAEHLAAELSRHFATPGDAQVEQDVRAALAQFTELSLVTTDAAH